MTVEIVGGRRGGAGMRKRLAATAETILGVLALGEMDVGIRLVDDVEIRKINKRFRHKDKSTNVLSFPDEDAPDAGAGGELAISLETAAREAGPDGDLETQLTRLVAHGILHLAGFDHHGKGRALWSRAEKRIESILKTTNREIKEEGLSLAGKRS